MGTTLYKNIPSVIHLDRNESSISEVPISEEERLEMIQIIEKDAREVDDVVAEIRDRAEELANYFEVVKVTLEPRASG